MWQFDKRCGSLILERIKRTAHLQMPKMCSNKVVSIQYFDPSHFWGNQNS